MHLTRSLSRDNPRLWRLAFLVICTVLVTVGVQGAEFGQVNNFRDQSIQLPIIYSYADASLYAGDFLLDARDTYVTWFYPALGVLSRMISLPLLMGTLYVAAVALTLSGVHTLAETLFPARGVGVFAVVLWMAYMPNPGGDFTHSPFVTHTTFAISIELWALVLLLRNRYGAGALLLGIAANINAMTAVFVTSAWLFSLLIDRRLRAFSWRTARALGVMALAASPILWWRFTLPVAESSPESFVDIVRIRLWYAAFPLSVSVVLWIIFAALLSLWVYAQRFGLPAQHRTVMGMAAGIGLLVTLGIIFSEIIPLKFVIELQVVRSTWLVKLLIVVYLAHLVRSWLWQARPRATLAAYGLLGFFLFPRWLMEVWPLALPTPYPLMHQADTAWAQAHRSLVAVLVIAAIPALLFVLWRLVGDKDRPAAPRAITWAAAGVILLTVPVFFESRVPDEQRATTAAWEDTLGWVAANTPRDAYFYTPPDLDGFRMEARRAHLGNWKDGTVGIFQDAWAVEWYRRMLDVGFDEATFSFALLDQDRLCFLLDKYALDYAIVYRSDDINGQPVYENTLFAVFPAEGVSCPGGMTQGLARP